jgi:hypothetical protein
MHALALTLMWQIVTHWTQQSRGFLVHLARLTF